jgi:glycosyltransferase involved in cell wall biosynthesis
MGNVWLSFSNEIEKAGLRSCFRMTLAQKMEAEEQRINVAFFYHFFPHYRGGVIKELSRRLKSTFVGDRVGSEGIKAYAFSNEEFYCSRTYYLGRLAFQPGVIRFCLVSPCQVFVFLASPNHISTWIGALIGRARGKRVVFWGHGFKSENKTFKNRVRKFFFSIAHGFFTYGWRAKQIAIALGMRSDSIYVGFNSLDYDVQLPVRKILAEQDHSCSSSGRLVNIFCISRLTKLCRYDMLFDAVASIRVGGVNCKITIVGDGPEKTALEMQAKNLKLDVVFLGEMYDEIEIARLIFAADVTVSPGKVGLTAMHSLMYGTPVISNDNFVTQMPEVEAVVPGFTGELFAEGSVNDLAEKLRSFPERFPNKKLTRERCFSMIDSFYNPAKQAEIMCMAVSGTPDECGNDAFMLFGQ